MLIKFSPQRSDNKLVVIKNGDELAVNGDEYDFSVIPEGATLLEVPGEFFVGPVSRLNGELELTLILPHGPNPPKNVAFPKNITVLEDGEVSFPSHFYEANDDKN